LQFLDIARCFPPQPEDGVFPGLKFSGTIDNSISAASTTPHTKAGKLKRAAESELVDVEELDPLDDSNDKDFADANHAKPISSSPHPKVKRSRIDNYGLDES
jgi:hypothetical protein